MQSKVFLRSLFAAAVCAAISAHAWEAPSLAPWNSTHLAGPWAAAQARNAARLGQAPLDQASFVLDDVALKQHRKFAEYSGDISGRWIGDAAFLADAYPVAFAHFPEVMAGLTQYQKPDGHFGTEQTLPQIERSRDMPLLWGNGRLLIGLVEVYECRGDQVALGLAKKLGDYFVATDAVYDREENLHKVGGSYADGFGTCYFSCIEGLAGLARVTKDPRYLEEAQRIANLALLVTDFDSLHSHGRLCAVRGFAELYALTHDARWRQAAERDWNLFNTRYLLPTGGVKEVLAAKCNRDEGCAESDWLRLNLLLWRLTGEGQYLDAAQYSLQNHFPYQQFANGGAGHRLFHQIDGQPVAFQALSEEAWWCCGEHWARALVDAGRYAVASDSRTLFINLPIDCDTQVRGPGGRWKISVREQADGLSVHLSPPQSTQAEVRIHRPTWAEIGRVEAPRGLKVRTEPGSWVISGAWRQTQELQLHRSSALRAQTCNEQSTVLLCGDQLLIAPASPTNAWLTDKLPAARPVLLWSPNLGSKNGKFQVPASLEANPDPAQPSQWHWLELCSLRAAAAAPDHQLAWFSFRARQVTLEQLQALLAKLPPTGGLSAQAK